ncbi:MAG: hypothetical protein KC636_14540, partial [Myxococcales bacterium]|nr:hypothetical protein [Myxococcales bacterium]
GNQPYAQPTPPPKPPPRRGVGMMAGGFSLFASTYLITAVVGAAIYDTCDSKTDVAGVNDCKVFGSRLLIPVVGPLIAMPNVTNISGRIWLFLPFATQTAGLALGIAGAVIFAKSRRQQQVSAYGIRLTRNLHLSGGPTPAMDGGSLGLHYQF